MSNLWSFLNPSGIQQQAQSSNQNALQNQAISPWQYQPGAMIPVPALSPMDDAIRKYMELVQQQLIASASVPIYYGKSFADLIGEPDKDFLDKVESLKTAEAKMVGRPVADYVEPIVGWRCWQVVSAPEGLRLKALGQNTIWQPKKALEATCASSGIHPVPFKGCQCGAWSFNNLPVLLEALKNYTTKPVIGTVSLWGRMVQCENGWRAQYAYPKELWLLDSAHEQLGYIYGVPVRTIQAASEEG